MNSDRVDEISALRAQKKLDREAEVEAREAKEAEEAKSHAASMARKAKKMATIYDKVKDYFVGLASDHAICSAFGTTFTFGTNLFIGIEPNVSVSCITIQPYAGPPPTPEGDRQESAMQIRLKTNNRQKAITVQQAIINSLHGNQLSGNGYITANNSSPTIIGILEGGEWIISVSNYLIKHVKI